MFFKLLSGKHHTGWIRKPNELTNPQLREYLDELGIHYRDTDKRERLITLLTDETGGVIDTRVTYVKGDVIESQQNLCELNDPGNPTNNKFEQVNEYGQAITDPRPVSVKTKKKPKPKDDGLASKTIKQLQEIAAAEEIDTEGLTRKEDLIAALRGTPSPA